MDAYDILLRRQDQSFNKGHGAKTLIKWIRLIRATNLGHKQEISKRRLSSPYILLLATSRCQPTSSLCL